MIEHKYVKVVLSHTGEKTNGYTIVSKSNDNPLGYISWYSPWRQYCFYTIEEIVFNHDCLNYIKEYLMKLNKQHRKQKNEN